MSGEALPLLAPSADDFYLLAPYEKARGRRRGPLHTTNDRKVREDPDTAAHRETVENPCKSSELRRSAARLKIVVSRFESGSRHRLECERRAPRRRAQPPEKQTSCESMDSGVASLDGTLDLRGARLL